ncbi:MAG: hypothetical protein R6V01_11545 [Thermoplasmatota archaeon]
MSRSGYRGLLQGNGHQPYITILLVVVLNITGVIVLGYVRKKRRSSRASDQNR